MRKLLDFLRNSIPLPKLPFLASLRQSFSTLSLDRFSKLWHKPAQKLLIFSKKANYARSLFLLIIILPTLIKAEQPKKTLPTSKICLALSVHNEPEIAIRCLNSLKDIVDCVSISDFSPYSHSAKTIEKFIQNSGIVGKVTKLKAQGMAFQRTLTVQNAQKFLGTLGFNPSETYLLALDDHAVLKIDADFKKSDLKEDAYLLFEKTPYLSYFNLHLLKASLHWENEGSFQHQWKSENVTNPKKCTTLKIEAEKDSDFNALKQKASLIEGEIDRQYNLEMNLFLLANLYKKLDDQERAIDCFKKKIQMSQNKEELWFSKYMLGVCYEELDEWDLALHWYFEAFQTDANRPEPLQRLATHYRLAGQSDLAYLFAKHGLRLPFAQNQIFYESSPLQIYQLDEELSIASYYTSFREEGLEAVDNLVLKRNVPWNIKNGSYQNMLFYVQNLKTTTFQPIQIDLPRIREDREDRYLPLNPSIIKTDEGYKLILRTVNFTQIGTIQYNTIEPDGIFRTRNYLIDYDKDFNILAHREIVDPLKREKKRSIGVEGLEDCRIFGLENGSWFTCTTTDTSPYNFQISVCKLDEENAQVDIPINKLIPLQGPDPYRCEKNWAPFVKDGVFYAIYSYDPFVIYQPNLETGESQTVLSYQPAHDFSHFRGSAAPIEFGEGYLMLIHEVVYRSDNSRIYLHRFVYADKDFRMQKLSHPFTFFHQGVEFCCSMTLDHTGTKLVLPIGVEDKEAYLCSIPTIEVQNLLKPLPTLHPTKPY